MSQRGKTFCFVDSMFNSPKFMRLVMLCETLEPRDDLTEVIKRMKDPIDSTKMQIDERKPGERADGVLSF